MTGKNLISAAFSRRYVWATFLAFGAFVCLLYLFVPPLKGSGPVINGLGLYGVLGVVAGIRIHRPRARLAWWCFALGLALFWLGDLYTYSYPKLFGADVPFPSLGDAIYLAVYPALMIGLVVLVRRRNQRADGPGAVDALIMTLGLSLISGILLIAPYVHDRTLTLLPKLVSIGYPMGDIILLAAGIRLAVDAGKRRPAFYLLIASIVTLLATDFVYGLSILHNTYDHQLWMDAGWIFFYLLWGAAALHPSMQELSEAADDRQPRLSWLRLAMLAGASLTAPALELIKVIPTHNWDLLFVVGASGVLFSLVVGRMTGLIREGIATIAFGRARIVAELLYRYVREELQRESDRPGRGSAGRHDPGSDHHLVHPPGPRLANAVRAYRGGYLAAERREIEGELFSGRLRGVVATSALELGVDVGGLDACVLNGFPGTIASMWQQAGRAGRERQASLAVLVAGDDQLDQWYMAHPDQVFSRPPEPAVINPANPYVLHAHLACAAHEQPLGHVDERWWTGTLDEGVRALALDDQLKVRDRGRGSVRWPPGLRRLPSRHSLVQPAPGRRAGASATGLAARTPPLRAQLSTLRRVGSRRSRSPSPSRFAPSTTRAIMSPGAVASHHAFER